MTERLIMFAVWALCIAGMVCDVMGAPKVGSFLIGAGAGATGAIWITYPRSRR